LEAQLVPPDLEAASLQIAQKGTSQQAVPKNGKHAGRQNVGLIGLCVSSFIREAAVALVLLVVTPLVVLPVRFPLSHNHVFLILSRQGAAISQAVTLGVSYCCCTVSGSLCNACLGSTAEGTTGRKRSVLLLSLATSIALWFQYAVGPAIVSQEGWI